jgi:hypothetical protein
MALIQAANITPSIFHSYLIRNSESKNDKRVRMKSLLVTSDDFIFTMICAGVKQLKRQFAALLGLNYDSLPNSCASSPLVAESERKWESV